MNSGGQPPVEELPVASVVIPTCNRRDQMRRCLDALTAQTHSNFEVIVVDDGSTDDTAGMVAQLSAAHPRLRLQCLRHERNIGANPSRNRGIAVSRGRFVVFLDSDCVPEPEWLSRLLAGFSSDRVAAVTGLVNDLPPTNVYERTFQGTHRLHRAGAAHRLVAGNMAVRRDVFAQLMLDEDRARPTAGPPDLTVSGRGDEEGLYLMIRAAGLDVMTVPDAVVLHEHGYTRRSFFKQAYRSGQSAARLVYKYYLGQRIDMVPFVLAYLTLPLLLGPPLLALVPLVFFAGAVAAISYNELFRKGKSIAGLARVFPVLLAYYHFRLAGYVRESLRLRFTDSGIARVRLTQSGHFQSDHLADGLGRRAVRAGTLSGAGNVGQFIVLIGGAVILARLLTPEDYGLVTMATALTSFIAGFKDIGLAASTVQRPDVSHEQTSALFWVNLAFGILFAAGVTAGAPVLVWFYDEPRVQGITLAMASTFVFSGLATQHYSLLRRQLRFGDLAGIELVANVVAVAAAIAAATYGAGYWSLVLMLVLTSFITTVGVWLRCAWRPGRPTRAAGLGAMLSYGGYLTGFDIANSFLRRFDRVLIGWWAGAGPLGLYSRALFLVSIPTERLSIASTGVAIPVLSRLQDDPPRFRAFVLTAALLFGTVAIPVGCFAFAAANAIVMALLGPQWADAVPILKALAPIAIFATFETATMWLSASTGHTRRQFIVGIGTAIAAAAAMVAGMQWGAFGVAMGFSGATAIAWTAGLVYCLRPLALTITDFLGVLWRPALASAAAAAVTIGIGVSGLFDSAVFMLAGQAIAFTVTYGLSWMLLPRGWATVKEIVSLAQALRQ